MMITRFFYLKQKPPSYQLNGLESYHYTERVEGQIDRGLCLTIFFPNQSPRRTTTYNKNIVAKSINATGP